MVQKDVLGIGQLEQLPDPGLVHHGSRHGLQAGGGAEKGNVLRNDAGVERPTPTSAQGFRA